MNKGLILLALVLLIAASFVAGWTGGKRSATRIAEETSPRFVVPRQKVQTGTAFNVGIECPHGYDMKFIAFTPNEEKEFAPKVGENMVEEVMKADKRTNQELNNAVCVKELSSSSN